VKKTMYVLAVIALSCLPILSGCSTMDASRPESMSQADSDVRSAVRDRLREDAVTSRTLFGVVVDSGVVTLTGVVSGPEVRARAVAIAEGTPGVSRVVDQTSRF
jgi:osmotically-inducible protein OsmY